MQKDELYKGSKKEALYEQLLTSLEGGKPRMHVIYVKDGETKKEAEARYLKETGSSIGANDIVFLVIYNNHLQSDG